jgi:hypothetical protein
MAEFVVYVGAQAYRKTAESVREILDAEGWIECEKAWVRAASVTAVRLAATGGRAAAIPPSGSQFTG